MDGTPAARIELDLFACAAAGVDEDELISTAGAFARSSVGDFCL